MKTVQSRLYTNVILTVIALSLAAIAFRPFVSVSTPAQAQISMGQVGSATEQRARSGDEKVAAATESVATANKDIAAAIREAAKAQTAMAAALEKLSKAGN